MAESRTLHAGHLILVLALVGTLILTPTPVLADPCPEPNDTASVACYLGTGAPAIGGLFDHAEDVDVYVFEVTTTGSRVQAMLTDLTDDADLFLRTVEGVSIAQSISDGVADERIDTTLDRGHYLLYVAGRGDYWLSLTNDQSPPPPSPDATPGPGITPTPPPDATPESLVHPWAAVELHMLELINRDRQAAGVAPLAWEPLAADAGLLHAQEMARQGYTGHLDPLGSLPQQRYTLLGGRDYVAENVACATGIQRQEDLIPTVDKIQALMLAETPPNDGHRQNILNPARTAVGIGVAWEGNRLCLAQELLNRYLALEGFPAQAAVGDRVRLVGRASDGYTVFGVALGYLPPATPLSVQELDAARSYRESDIYAWLPVAVDPDGIFRTDAAFNHEAGAGRYQLFIWVQDAAGTQILAANPMAEVR